jgi:hypothetical protein
LFFKITLYYKRVPSMKFASRLSRIAVAAVGLWSSCSAHAIDVTMDNWRHIYMNGAYSSGGSSELLGVYAVHTNRQENLVFDFNLSTYAGSTAAGGATISFVTAGGPGERAGGSYTLELRQLNSYNAVVNLDNAGSYWRDSANATPGTLAWYNNSGAALSNLNYTDSVLDITSGLVSSITGPVAGDTGSADITSGVTLTFNISQAVLQSWLDGSLPATLVMDINRAGGPMVDVIAFASNAALSFNTTSASGVPVPATLLLGATGLGALGLTRRKQKVLNK